MGQMLLLARSPALKFCGWCTTEESTSRIQRALDGKGVVSTSFQMPTAGDKEWVLSVVLRTAMDQHLSRGLVVEMALHICAVERHMSKFIFWCVPPTFLPPLLPQIFMEHLFEYRPFSWVLGIQRKKTNDLKQETHRTYWKLVPVFKNNYRE